MNENENQIIIEEALNAACLAVQERIGVTDGGWASLFFTGENRQKFDDLFSAYIRSEKSSD